MMSGVSRLQSAIAQAAVSLPDWAIEAVAGILSTYQPANEPLRRSAVLGCVALPHHRNLVRAILDAWVENAPDVSSETVATALECAAIARRSSAVSQTTSLVWTGPITGGIYLRNTEQALLDVINGAHTHLLIVTFAAYRINTITNALRRAADRGVQISFVAESAEESNGRVSFDPAVALGSELAARCAVYIWPNEKRLRDSVGRSGALHAKCAIADDNVLLVSSANLTDHALSLNMEIGILVEGGALPYRVSQQFIQMIADGILIPGNITVD